MNKTLQFYHAYALPSGTTSVDFVGPDVCHVHPDTVGHGFPVDVSNHSGERPTIPCPIIHHPVFTGTDTWPLER